MKKQLLIPLLILLFLIAGTALAVSYARGYRLSFSSGDKFVAGTGLLVVTSNPNGAQVFIDDKLITATDNTINLTPGSYKVRIEKQGYLPWSKTIKVKEEVVSNANALLFPTAPRLDSITDNGVDKATIDPSGSRIAYVEASGSAQQKGIYVLSMNSVPIIGGSSKQIVDDSLDQFSKASLSWSPDGTSILATVSANLGIKTTYLLDSSSFNQNPQDVSETLEAVKNDWSLQQNKKDKALFSGLKTLLTQTINTNFSLLKWSPDETKIAYIASQSATLPIIIKPRLTGVDLVPEERNIQKGQAYIYDMKEDKNYKLNIAPQLFSSARWLADSTHLIYVIDSQIHAVEMDGGNDTIIYAGPFIDSYVFPWTDTSKIVIVTNLNNPQIAPNFYTIGLK